MPPSIGPTTNPMPNAAPSIPIPLARVCGVVTSLMKAWAVEMLPPVNPSIMRER